MSRQKATYRLAPRPKPWPARERWVPRDHRIGRSDPAQCVQCHTFYRSQPMSLKNRRPLRSAEVQGDYLTAPELTGEQIVGDAGKIKVKRFGYSRPPRHDWTHLAVHCGRR